MISGGIEVYWPMDQEDWGVGLISNFMIIAEGQAYDRGNPGQDF